MSDYEIEIGVGLLATELASNGSPVGQTGDAINNVVDSSGAEIYGPIGYCARPSKAIAGQSSCQAVAIKGGSRDALVAFRDTRAQEIYGNLSEGDVCIYSMGPDGSGTSKLSVKGDGSIILSTERPGTAPIEGNVGVYLRLDRDKLEFRAPWGRMTFDNTGFTVVCQNGAKFNLGGVTPAFGAAVGLSSYCNIHAQTINLAGICNLGPPVSQGGLPKMPAMISLIPPVGPFVPATGVGVGAVTLFQTPSTHVFIGA
jgi:hypothetical protein